MNATQPIHLVRPAAPAASRNERWSVDAIEALFSLPFNDLIFLAQANTEQGKAALKHGLRVAEEVFADRTYTDAGLLTPRKEANSMIKDPAKAVEHVRRMVDEQAIYSTSGRRIPCRVDSICVHGDGPTAVTVSKAVREGLEAAGIRIVPLPEMPSLRH